ncbi:hypothetical protein ACJX0J_027326, partial [Zea mays]
MLRGGGELDSAARQGLLRRVGLVSGCGGQRDAQPVAYIYEAHVRRYFKIGCYVSPSYSEHHRRVLQMTSLDACRSVERFIDTHGPDALDRIIRA